jgi:hypothetical protein
MKVITRNPEEHQFWKDQAFVTAEKDFLEMQELTEEMNALEQKPANIVIIEEEEYEFWEDTL